MADSGIICRCGETLQFVTREGRAITLHRKPACKDFKRKQVDFLEWLLRFGEQLTASQVVLIREHMVKAKRADNMRGIFDKFTGGGFGGFGI